MALATATATSIEISTATPACAAGPRRPWLALGLSERTYYRRKAVGALEAEAPPEQHAAHVAAWFATLGSFARLDHRAFVRRCLLARRQAVSFS